MAEICGRTYNMGVARGGQGSNAPSPVVDGVDFVRKKLALLGLRRLVCGFSFQMNMSLSGLCISFSKVTLFSLPKCSVDLKYAKNALVAEAPPDPSGVAYDAPQTL